jgi:hypothetical protein
MPDAALDGHQDGIRAPLLAGESEELTSRDIIGNR